MRRTALPVFGLICYACALALALLVSPAPRPAAAQGADVASRPVSLAIIYDTSDGLNGYSKPRAVSFDGKKQLFAALTEFLSSENPQNEYFVVHFNTVPYEVLAGSVGVGPSLRAVKKLSGARREGGTALFDACLFAVEKLAKARHDARAIILLSDGIDTLSRRKLEDAARALADSKVALYAVNIGRRDEIKSLDSYEQGDRILERLAAASGGALFRLGENKDQNTIFRAIAAKLRNAPAAGSQ